MLPAWVSSVLGAVDRDAQVLPAGREDLLVQHPVAVVGGDGALVHVLFGQRGQDADHDQPAAGLARPGVRGVEAGADLLLQVREHVTLKPPGRHVDLEIELPELGRPGGIGDRVEHGRVAHGRLPVGVHQVQLDLHAHPGRAGLEPALAEHPGEHVQRTLHLFPVLAPVLTTDRDGLNVASHEAPARRDGRAPTPQRASYGLTSPASWASSPAWVRVASPARPVSPACSP